jgi:hypothetical protein
MTTFVHHCDPQRGESGEHLKRQLNGICLSVKLGERPGERVAFVGAKRFGFGKTRTALIREYMTQGLRPGEFLVRRIEPQIEDVAERPHAPS